MESLIFLQMKSGRVRWEDFSPPWRTGARGAGAFVRLPAASRVGALKNLVPKAFGMILLDQAKSTKKNRKKYPLENKAMFHLTNWLYK